MRKLSVLLLLLVLSLQAYSQESPELYYITGEQLSQLENLQKMQQAELTTLSTQCDQLQQQAVILHQQQETLMEQLNQSEAALIISRQETTQLQESLDKSASRNLLITVGCSVLSFILGAGIALIVVL